MKKLLALEHLNAFHELDNRTTLNMLRYFMTICEKIHDGITARDLAVEYGNERHTNTAVINRLIKLDLISLEVVNHMQQNIHLTQKGWEFYLELETSSGLD